MKEIIKKIIHKYLAEANEVSNNQQIQQIIDIIDNLNTHDNEKRNKYIERNDEELINNANIKDIKTIDDFRSYLNYRKYAEKLLRIREKNVDYSRFYDYSPTSLSKKQLLDILKKYNIDSLFTKQGFISSPSGENSIDWAGDTFDKSHILHELAHLVENRVEVPITYALTDYSLTNQSECTAESVMLNLLNKEYYQTIIPGVGMYLEKNTPNWIVNLSKEIINKQ